MSALMASANKGRLEVVELLLEAGAAVDVQDPVRCMRAPASALLTPRPSPSPLSGRVVARPWSTLLRTATLAWSRRCSGPAPTRTCNTRYGASNAHARLHQSATNVCAFAYVRRIRVVYTKGTTFSKGSLTFLVYARHVCMGCTRKNEAGASQKGGRFACTLGISPVYAKYVEPVQEPVLSTDSN